MKSFAIKATKFSLLLVFNILLILLWYSPPGIDFIHTLFGDIIWHPRTFILVIATICPISYLFNTYWINIGKLGFITVQIISFLIIVGIPFFLALMLAMAHGI